MPLKHLFGEANATRVSPYQLAPRADAGQPAGHPNWTPVEADSKVIQRRLEQHEATIATSDDVSPSKASSDMKKKDLFDKLPVTERFVRLKEETKPEAITTTARKHLHFGIILRSDVAPITPRKKPRNTLTSEKTIGKWTINPRGNRFCAHFDTAIAVSLCNKRS